MNHQELVDKVSSKLFKKIGKVETRKSWQAMRIYLNQLDDEQLKGLLISKE